MNWIDEVRIAFRELENDEELGYFCITTKPEGCIRDKLTYRLQKNHPDLYLSREAYTSANSTARKRLDFAAFDPEGKLLAGFEAKALLYRDLFWSIEQLDRKRPAHGTFADIRNDVVYAKAASAKDAKILGILFLWQIMRADDDGSAISSVAWYSKYGTDHAKSFRLKEHLTYRDSFARALAATNLQLEAIDDISCSGPHGLSVQITMAVLDLAPSVAVPLD